MTCWKVLDGQPCTSCGQQGINSCSLFFSFFGGGDGFAHNLSTTKDIERNSCFAICNIHHFLLGSIVLFSSQGTAHLIIPMSIAKEDLWIVQWSHYYSWERGAEINKTGLAIMPNYDFSFTKFTFPEHIFHRQDENMNKILPTSLKLCKVMEKETH